MGYLTNWYYEEVVIILNELKSDFNLSLDTSKDITEILYSFFILQLQNTSISKSQWLEITQDSDTWNYYFIDIGYNGEKNILWEFFNRLYSLIIKNDKISLIEEFNCIVKNINIYTQNNYDILIIFEDNFEGIKELPENPFASESSIKNLNLHPPGTSIRSFIKDLLLDGNNISYTLSHNFKYSEWCNIKHNLKSLDKDKHYPKWALIFYIILNIKPLEKFEQYKLLFEEKFQSEKSRPISIKTFKEDYKRYCNNFLRDVIDLEYTVNKNSDGYWDIIKT